MKHFRKLPEAKEQPLSPKPGRLWEYVLEMYAPPSDVRLRPVPSGRAGMLQDKMRIRGYFKAGAEKALGSGKR